MTMSNYSRFDDMIHFSRIGVILHVEDFAKIKSAHVNISGYTLFVGHNNSGKTMLMQLIYGILDAFASGESSWSDVAADTFNNLNSLSNNDISINADTDFYEKIQHCMNIWLEQNIKDIIRKTFQQDIEIGRVSCELCCPIGEYKIKISNSKSNQLSDAKSPKDITFYDSDKNVVSSLLLNADIISNESIKLVIWCFIYQVILNLGYVNRKNLIYLPAARAGLLLLAPYYFDRLANDTLASNNISAEMSTASLSLPVTNYLRFLVKYKLNENSKNQNQAIIDYIENELTHGSFEFNSIANIFFIESETNIRTPIHLTSSMLTEVMPFVQIFSGEYDYTNIMCDEVENSIHPSLQRKLSCLFNRIVNSGKNLLISTHSDSMAFAINNTLLLSKITGEKRNELLNKLGYSNEDLLVFPKINVYQFEGTADGNVVKQIDDRLAPPYGLQFEQFDQSTMKLYNDAEAIMEALNE